MTPEEFLRYCGQADGYRDKGKARLSRARDVYAGYVTAYLEESLSQLCAIVEFGYGGRKYGAWQAVKDRDAGLPMAAVPEFADVLAAVVSRRKEKAT